MHREKYVYNNNNNNNNNNNKKKKKKKKKKNALDIFLTSLRRIYFHWVEECILTQSLHHRIQGQFSKKKESYLCSEFYFS